MKSFLLVAAFLGISTPLFSQSFTANVSSSHAADAVLQKNPESVIDHLVSAKLEQQDLEPNPAIDDATFLRRIYLDIAGRIPTIEEAEAFHADEYPNKREKLIEQLLHSEAYVSNFYNFWADILRINRRLGNSGNEAEAAYQLWVKQALRENMSYRDFAHELVRARGHIWENGAAGYYQRDRGMPLDNMSNTVRIFLGVRLECAQCHDHPFDKWTQMDYYKMAAFSYGMNANGYGRENRSAMRKHVQGERVAKFREAVGNDDFPVFRRERDLKRAIQRHKKRGQFDKILARMDMTEKEFRRVAQKGIAAVAAVEEDYQGMREAERQLYQRVRYTTTVERERKLKLPHDYQYSDAKPHDPVSPETMFGYDIDPAEVDDSMIDAYAAWLTSDGNPTFTRVIANRLWKRVFGLGVYEPVDELTDHTPISNPELMSYLEELMKELDYDMKAFLKVLYNTKTYQRQADDGEIILGAPYYFQGPVLRRMSAEQMWDSIVGLALPEADSYRPRLKSQLAGINKLQLMYESIAERTPEEYVAMVREIGKAIEDAMPRMDQLRAELVTARQEDRVEDYRELRQELRKVQSGVRRKVSEIGYVKLKQEVEPGALMAAMGMSEMSMTAMSSMTDGMPNEEKEVLTKLPKPKFPKPPADLNRAQRKAWQNQKRAEHRTYSKLVAKMARASELPSPAPRGHFLREFGQSDREVIENASDHASVPQALNLLNGPIVEALVNPFAVFGSRIHEAGAPEEKIDAIFQAMLTRPPTSRERELALTEVERSGDEAYEGLVWALLNTQQFLFIQ